MRFYERHSLDLLTEILAGDPGPGGVYPLEGRLARHLLWVARGDGNLDLYQENPWHLLAPGLPIVKVWKGEGDVYLLKRLEVKS